MPKLSGKFPRYRRHRATGQAVVTLSGHDHYLGRYGTKTSEREYDRLIAEWLAGGRRPLIEDSDVTVVELAAAYWKSLQVNRPIILPAGNRGLKWREKLPLFGGIGNANPRLLGRLWYPWFAFQQAAAPDAEQCGMA